MTPQEAEQILKDGGMHFHFSGTEMLFLGKGNCSLQQIEAVAILMEYVQKAGDGDMQIFCAISRL